MFFGFLGRALSFVVTRTGRFLAKFLVSILKTLLGGRDAVGRMAGRLALAFILIFSGLVVRDFLTSEITVFEAYDSYKEHLESGDIRLAVKSGESAVRLALKHNILSKPDVAPMTLELAEGYRELKEWEQSAQLYERTVDYARSARPEYEVYEPAPFSIFELSKVSLAHGEVLIEGGAVHEAVGAFVTAVEIYAAEPVRANVENRFIVKTVLTGTDNILLAAKTQPYGTLGSDLAIHYVTLAVWLKEQGRDSRAERLLDIAVSALEIPTYEKELSTALLHRALARQANDMCSPGSPCPRAASDALRGVDLALSSHETGSRELFEALALATWALYQSGETQAAATHGRAAIALGETLQLQDLPEFQRLVADMIEILEQAGARDESDQLSARYPDAEESGARFFDVEKNYTVVRLFYGTSRKPDRKPEFPPYYQGGPSKKPGERGFLEVTIPTNCEPREIRNDDGEVEIKLDCPHRVGQIEEPRAVKKFFGFTISKAEAEDQNKHVVVRKPQVYAKPEDFHKAISAEMKERAGPWGKKQAFIFVHGYNTPFEDAAKRAGQIAYDIKFQGIPTFYSWPSEGNKFAYLFEQKVPDSVEQDMRLFFEEVLEHSGADQVHIIAHSMGNHYLLTMLKNWAAEYTPQEPPFDEIIFAAADVDGKFFEEVAPTLQGWSNRMTLYSSKDDSPLAMSRYVNRISKANKKSKRYSKRAGDANPVTIAEGVHTIDATDAKEGIGSNGHSYFSENESILTDIRALMWHDLNPEKRCILKEVEKDGQIYWKYNAEVKNCAAPAFDQAAALVVGTSAQEAHTWSLAKLAEKTAMIEELEADETMSQESLKHIVRQRNRWQEIITIIEDVFMD